MGAPCSLPCPAGVAVLCLLPCLWLQEAFLCLLVAPCFPDACCIALLPSRWSQPLCFISISIAALPSALSLPRDDIHKNDTSSSRKSSPGPVETCKKGTQQEERPTARNIHQSFSWHQETDQPF